MGKKIANDDWSPSLNKIEEVFSSFATLPKEAIIKEDLLRSGMAFSPDALTIASGYKPKAYFIFSFDLTPIAEMGQRENLRSPEEIRLSGGPYRLRDTIVSVRNNAQSPYLVDVHEGRLALLLEKELIAFIQLPEKPIYYNKKIANGKPVSEYCPTIEWGYLIYLTVYRQCQYWGRDEECLFCDINENYRQQKQAGRPYQISKDPQDVVAALEILDQDEPRARAYTITGGSITSRLKGQSEAAFYLQFARAIESRFPGRWIGKVVLQALDKEELLPFKEAGIQIYHPNYEIWDENLFKILCPGKQRYIGRENWHQKILASAQIFGSENVIPNFVAGIEMSRPYGYISIDQAVASTTAGLDFFMSRGIVPRYTVWCPEPMTALAREGKHFYGAPLAFHAALMESYLATFLKYNLPIPPGYGQAGLGRAVFSVSAFMDILGNEK